MTEDEASKRWCPFVQVLVTPYNPTWEGYMLTNRGDTRASNADLTCRGSGCMAWRWRHRPAPDAPVSPSDGDGYCGLAGDPYALTPGPIVYDDGFMGTCEPSD